jgi:N-acetylneuraminate synthase
MDIILGNHTIGKNSPCFIIAEIGTAHCGDLDKAYQLIDAAGNAGADCVKFQLVYADEILHPATGLVDLPGGRIDLYRRFKELEQPVSFYQHIKEYTEKQGLFFLCTPFGIKSARVLQRINAGALKIASPELNHFPLLEEIAGYGIPLLFSTGVSLLKDIEQALLFVHGPVILLHCITAYPAPEEEYNLSLLPLLRGIFGTSVGISDHSPDPVAVPALAKICGAEVIEKHFTLSRDDPGLDDVIALSPGDFKRMVESVRQIETMDREEALEWVKSIYGEGKVNLILGDGVKRLAPSEKDNYTTTRRSIHAVREMKAGELIDEESLLLYRSEKNLSPGLDPCFMPMIIGKPCKRPIHPGEGISWDDFL